MVEIYRFTGPSSPPSVVGREEKADFRATVAEKYCAGIGGMDMLTCEKGEGEMTRACVRDPERKQETQRTGCI